MIRANLTSEMDVAARTAALQQAIDEAARVGSTAVAPAGRWAIRMLRLHSNMTFRLERGCVLEADGDLSQYPSHPRGHNNDRQPYHLVYAEDCENLTVEGDGVIDGCGPQFWDGPTGEGPNGRWNRAKPHRISPMFELRRCRNVVLRDFSLINSPGWTLHAFCCESLRIDGVTVRNDLFGPNTDGFDLNGCRDVIVSNCDLTCGDDAIIIKATDDAQSSERIAVTGCICASNCAAFGLGAETSSGIRDVTFAGCVARQALRIIQIECWEPGVVENVTFTGITGRAMADVVLERPIYIDIQHHRRTDGRLGVCRNIVISGFTAETRGRVMLTAADGAAIENVTLRDVQLMYPELEDASRTVPGHPSSQMSNDCPETRAANGAVVLDNVHGLQLANVVTQYLQAEADRVEYYAIVARRAKDVVIDSPQLRPSRAGLFAIDQTDCELDVRAIGD